MIFIRNNMIIIITIFNSNANDDNYSEASLQNPQNVGILDYLFFIVYIIYWILLLKYYKPFISYKKYLSK